MEARAFDHGDRCDECATIRALLFTLSSTHHSLLTSLTLSPLILTITGQEQEIDKEQEGWPQKGR